MSYDKLYDRNSRHYVLWQNHNDRNSKHYIPVIGFSCAATFPALISHEQADLCWWKSSKCIALLGKPVGNRLSPWDGIINIEVHGGHQSIRGHLHLGWWSRDIAPGVHRLGLFSLAFPVFDVTCNKTASRVLEVTLCLLELHHTFGIYSCQMKLSVCTCSVTCLLLFGIYFSAFYGTDFTHCHPDRSCRSSLLSHPVSLPIPGQPLLALTLQHHCFILDLLQINLCCPNVQKQ